MTIGTYTAEGLKAEGFKGFQKNSFTGNLLNAPYALELIAWAHNNNPTELRHVFNDLGGTVKVYYTGTKDGFSHLDRFIERPMTFDELVEADKRLDEAGVIAPRRQTQS